jgi:hypothetical protein
LQKKCFVWAAGKHSSFIYIAGFTGDFRARAYAVLSQGKRNHLIVNQGQSNFSAARIGRVMKYSPVTGALFPFEPAMKYLFKDENN